MTDPELDDRLAELLVSYDVLARPALDRARQWQQRAHSTLVGALTTLHLVPTDVVRPLLEELTGARGVDPTLITVYPDFIERINGLIPAEVIGSLLIFPAQMELNTLHVCMLNPTDGWTVGALEALSGCRVVPLVSDEPSVLSALVKHYAQLPRTPQYGPDEARGVAESAYRGLLDQSFDSFLRPAVALVNRQRDALRRDPAALEAVIRDPAIIRLVQQLLCRAIEMGASDVHLEPDVDEVRIRARVDGAMHVLHRLPPALAIPIVARVKAMADLPITPSQSPIDARIGYDLVWGRGVDLRLSLVPAVAGEKTVLRVLDRTRERRALTDLGFDEVSRIEIERAVSLPNGLILVTGPTGSGKSSTLYALIDRLNEDGTAILTAEDPVESRIGGVTQVACDERSGISFASALRSFLRQDPDVLMVGEVRDTETADLALKAALTGHLVLSTLHTNDAPGAVLRLTNMGLEPFLIASALRLVVAQRLVRRLCGACKKPAPTGSASLGLRRSLSCDLTARLGEVAPYEPVGCSRCGGSGYRGRLAIAEVLRVTEAIEELIIARAPASVIRTRARVEGMRTLREAGLDKVASGETTIAEILEHTIAEQGEAGMSVEEERINHVAP